MKQIAEVMLRYHSQLKVWYQNCANNVEKEYEEGYFMDQVTLWKMLTANRLVNGRFSIPMLCRMMARYGSREFDLHFNKSRLQDETDLIKKYDFESSEIENELSRFDDKGYVSKKLEELLLDEQAAARKRRETQYQSGKILLFRTFINAIIRKLSSDSPRCHLPQERQLLQASS